jgi:hypothetical protein
MTLPLSGITVLEFSQYLTGSYAEATSISGDLPMLANRPLHVFNTFKGFRNKQVRKLMHRNLSFPMLLKMEELLDQHAVHRTQRSVSLRCP